MIKSFTYLLLFALLLQACIDSSKNSVRTETEPMGANNLAYQWGKITLELTANDTERFRPRPTVTSRILALTWTAVFDAWSRYDEKATPLYLENVERRPVEEHTLQNKEKAISYAAYRAMLTYYFADSILLKEKMTALGFDPNDHSLDPSTPTGIGNLAAQAVIEARQNDGSNQLGNMKNSNGTIYSDYTGYAPINSADNLTDLSRWQPKYFSDGQGGKFAPGCLTPQ